jgi:hypothetical protein
VAADEVFVGGNVDADDLVGGDVGVDPLDLGAKVAEDGAGGLGCGYQLVGSEVAYVGHIAFDEELWHLILPFLEGGLPFAAGLRVIWLDEDYVTRMS